MTQLAGWQSSYYMILTTDITQSAGFTDGVDIGTYGKTIPRVFLNNQPSFEQNREVLATPKSTGLSYISKTDSNTDRLIGKQAPTTSYEMDLDAAAIFVPLMTLFQDAGALVSSVTTKQFNCYTTAGVTYYATLKRILETNKSQIIKGAIAKSINIKGNEGEAVTVTVDWVGASMDYSGTTAATTTISKLSNNTILFENLVFDLGNDAVNFLDVIGFDLTISNNATPRYYNNSSADNFILGKMSIEGTLKFPWGDSKLGGNTLFTYLNNQTDFVLSIYNSFSATAVGNFKILLNIECDNVTTNADDEISNEINFVGIYDGFHPPVRVYTYDSITRTI